MAHTHSADFWYRHETDTDRSVRAIPQMTMGVDAETEAIAEADRMTRSGYTIQRIDLAATCPHCQGAGRLGKAPKGTRKAKIGNLPAWMLKWTDCPVCKGDGHVSRETVFTS